MLFGNLKIINIYVAKCLKKRCHEIIELNLNDTQCGFRPGRSTTDQIVSLSSKFLRNLESMPNRVLRGAGLPALVAGTRICGSGAGRARDDRFFVRVT